MMTINMTDQPIQSGDNTQIHDQLMTLVSLSVMKINVKREQNPMQGVRTTFTLLLLLLSVLNVILCFLSFRELCFNNLEFSGNPTDHSAIAFDDIFCISDAYCHDSFGEFTRRE